ncbi:ankyrin repeat protein [Aureibacter tunicatorum]|uniref:Ankyrin repeat protein n=1 Tax=Aureibacter tunicatorum TaxID=866807 RepID=A0AAE3XUN1_9BACT|nr:ankyrin repeat protein [Aureibacter tunicatorum]
MKRVLHQKIDLNQRNEKGLTPLICAVEHDCIDIAKLFIENGADVNYIGYNQWSLLHHAVDIWYEEVKNGDDKGDISIIKLLVENGVDYLMKDINGQTPLSIAQEINFIQAIEYFQSLNGD